MDKPNEFLCDDPSGLDILANQIIELTRDERIFAFYGQMGAGKTTFIKSFCRALEVNDNVSSPTFSIVNEYLTSNNEPVYHFDFYRIKKMEELLDIGIGEYLESGFYCLIEWPERFQELLPPDYVYISINVNPDLTRSISFHIES